MTRRRSTCAFQLHVIVSWNCLASAAGGVLGVTGAAQDGPATASGHAAGCSS
jgi:hypothetical protein